MLSKYDNEFIDLYLDIIGVIYEESYPPWSYWIHRNHIKEYIHKLSGSTEGIYFILSGTHRHVLSQFLIHSIPLDIFFESVKECFNQLDDSELDKIEALLSYYKKDLTKEDITMIKMSI